MATEGSRLARSSVRQGLGCEIIERRGYGGGGETANVCVCVLGRRRCKDRIAVEDED